MDRPSPTFRIGKLGGQGIVRDVASVSQVTPSGRTVVTVNRDDYAAALRAASKVISSGLKQGTKKR